MEGHALSCLLICKRLTSDAFANSIIHHANHPRIFDAPLSPSEAQGNIERLMECPRVRTLSEGEGFWSVYRDLAGRIPARGNTVPDAHLAAILKQHGIRTLYTRDRDFAKFPFLRTVDPLAEAKGG